MGGFELAVDSAVHRREIGRFWRKVVRGPGTACWYWTGAIGDDGYGNFSVRRPVLDGAGRPMMDLTRGRPLMREHMVSAPRYAVAASLGVTLTQRDVAEHAVCDEPICVRAHDGLVDGGLSHVVLSTQAENLASMGRRGRGGGSPRPWGGLGHRAVRVARSRALREVVLMYGWDPVRMADAVAALEQRNQGRLF